MDIVATKPSSPKPVISHGITANEAKLNIIFYMHIQQRPVVFRKLASARYKSKTNPSCSRHPKTFLLPHLNTISIPKPNPNPTDPQRQPLSPKPLRTRPPLLLHHHIDAPRTVPRPVGLALEPHAAPVEPLVRTLVIVAGDHVAETHVLTQTIFIVISGIIVVHVHGVVLGPLVRAAVSLLLLVSSERAVVAGAGPRPRVGDTGRVGDGAVAAPVVAALALGER